MKGITQRTYNGYRKRRGLSIQSVQLISRGEMFTIYRENYWDSARCGYLPDGIDYCVFDASINSGPTQAIKWLQRALAAFGLYHGTVDGQIGESTIAAAESADSKDIEKKIINHFCDQRLAFMQSLRNWESFKNGWTTRVREVRAQSIAWVDSIQVVLPHTELDANDSGKALPSETKVTRTPEGADATKDIALGSGGLFAWILGQFDKVNYALSAFTGMEPATAKIVVQGVIVVTVVASVGFGIYSIIKVISRRGRGESVEAS